MAQEFLNIVGITGVFTIRVDDAGSGITYIGKADPGSSEASGVWQISRIDESSPGQTIILFPDGQNSFDKIWDNRASLSYS